MVMFILGLWPLAFTLIYGVPKLWLPYHRKGENYFAWKTYFAFNKLGLIDTVIFELYLFASGQLGV